MKKGVVKGGLAIGAVILMYLWGYHVAFQTFMAGWLH